MALYRDELIHLDIRRHYQGVDKPTEVYQRLMEPERKAKKPQKIIADILKKLG